MEMGERIRQLRLEKGITQEELGKVIGVQKSAIRKYESGLVENLKRSSIEKMANFFGVRPSYLMCFDETSDITTDDKLNRLHNYMKENKITTIKFVPVYININTANINWKKENISGYTPLDSNIQGCNENNNYFYYQVHNDFLNKTILKGSYILIEDTQDVEINDIIIYSENSKIEIGLYTLNLIKENNITIIGKYIK